MPSLGPHPWLARGGAKRLAGLAKAKFATRPEVQKCAIVPALRAVGRDRDATPKAVSARSNSKISSLSVLGE